MREREKAQLDRQRRSRVRAFNREKVTPSLSQDEGATHGGRGGRNKAMNMEGKASALVERWEIKIYSDNGMEVSREVREANMARGNQGLSLPLGKE